MRPARLADLILVPVRPTSQFDLETLGNGEADRANCGAGRPSWVMLSQVPTNSRKVAVEGEEAIAGYGMPLVPVRFHSRADYAYAMTEGLTAPGTLPRESIRGSHGPLPVADERTPAEWLRPRTGG